MMTKTAIKKNLKYKSILSAAYELLGDNGLASVSIDEIVKAAGVAKGTFYLYFKDKYDLISKLIMEKAIEYMSVLNPEPHSFEGDADLSAHIKKYIDLVADFLLKNKMLTHLIDKNVHIYVNAMIENREGVIKTVYDNIYDYIVALGFSPRSTEMHMYLFIDLTVSSCCNAILRGRPYTLEGLKPYLYDITTQRFVRDGEPDKHIREA